ncbi:hypothetical protein ABPG77_001980 [Micractinium sp. CCAP 211/92]
MTSPAVALLLAALASLAWGTQGARLLQADQTFEVANITLEFAAYNNMLDEPLLTVSKASKAGRQLYYEVPQAPVGVLAFFHGCAHNAYDLWPPQLGCEECRGLPGEVSHTKQALSLGYAVVAMNSLDRSNDPSKETYRCFSYSDDRESAVEALKDIISDLELEDLPLYLAGVSSGGSFALKLLKDLSGELEVSGVISEVLSIDPDKDSYDFETWPPVAFIEMQKDTPTNERIERNQEVLAEAGVPAQIIHVPERAVYPTFFSDQAADISPQLSIKIVAALKQIGVLDEKGWLLDDPRHGFDSLDWRAELKDRVPELSSSKSVTYSITPDASDVSELLNTAYSSHEIVGDYTTACLKWFEGGASDDLEQLAQARGRRPCRACLREIMGEARPRSREYVIRKPALLSAARLQPGQKPATAGGPPPGPER